MIIRQFAVRHGITVARTSATKLTLPSGRPVLAFPKQCSRRTYATDINLQNRALRVSTQDNGLKDTVPGHLSDPSSILDQSHLPPTRTSREAAEQLAKIINETTSVQAEVSAFTAAKDQSTSIAPSYHVASEQPPVNVKENRKRLNALFRSQLQQREATKVGSKLRNVYNPNKIVTSPPKPDQITLPMLLANQTHLGHATALWNPRNSSYIFGIRDGIHIISLDITLAYLRRAAKVVREVARRGGIILFVGTRKGQQQIVVNAARLAEGYHIFDRWVGGILTNGQQILEHCAIKVVDNMDNEIPQYKETLGNSNHPVLRPDLVICLNPIENEVCLHECGLYTVPTIGVIDTDANPASVTYPIPANDDSLRSIALIAGALGRAGEEGHQLRREGVKKGETSLDSSYVQDMLEHMAELAAIDVSSQGNKEKDKDE